MKSEKDFIYLVKNRRGAYYWETAIIAATVLSVFDDVKVGDQAKVVLAKIVSVKRFEFNGYMERDIWEAIGKRVCFRPVSGNGFESRFITK